MEKVIKVSSLLDNSAYSEAIYGWGEKESEIRLGQKIRVSFTGLRPKTGYAYKEEGSWLGIRYTWSSRTWWSLLNYNNPLIKLEVQELDGEGNAYWTTLWEREGER